MLSENQYTSMAANVIVQKCAESLMTRLGDYWHKKSFKGHTTNSTRLRSGIEHCFSTNCHQFTTFVLLSLVEKSQIFTPCPRLVGLSRQCVAWEFKALSIACASCFDGFNSDPVLFVPHSSTLNSELKTIRNSNWVATKTNPCCRHQEQ